MMFKRRRKLNFFQRTREVLWPGAGWRRWGLYMAKRMLRIAASPHAVAAGFAAGVFASFTPLVGFHFIVSFLVATLVGGSWLAAALGTTFGNPLTFPLIWGGTLKLGSWMLGQPVHMPTLELSEAFSHETWDLVWPVLKPMLVGAIPLGLVVALALYFPVRFGVAAYQERRRRRFKTGKMPLVPGG